MDGITNQLTQLINTASSTFKPVQPNNKFAELVFDVNPDETNCLDEPVAPNEYGAVLEPNREIFRSQEISAGEDRVDINYPMFVTKKLFNKSEYPDTSVQLQPIEPVIKQYERLKAEGPIPNELLSNMDSRRAIPHPATLLAKTHAHATQVALTQFVPNNSSVIQSTIRDLNGQAVDLQKNNETIPVTVLDNFVDHFSLGQKSDRLVEVETIVTEHSIVSEVGSTIIQAASAQPLTQMLSSELYDQKWYSIGKLSYVELNTSTIANSITEPTSGPIVAFVKANSTNPLVDTAILEYTRQPFPDTIVSNYAQANADPFSEPKKYVSLATSVASPQLHEIEKRKISILKGEEGQTLAVRDYTSSTDNLNAQVNQYVTLYGHSISKITINGKMSN